MDRYESKDLEKDFMDYLQEQGYSVKTPKGKPSTVYDYAKRINHICDREGITWAELAAKVDYYCSRYEIGGPEEDFGSKSHNAPRAALRCFRSFIGEGR